MDFSQLIASNASCLRFPLSFLFIFFPDVGQMELISLYF